jgi:hypothetical protein
MIYSSYHPHFVFLVRNLFDGRLNSHFKKEQCNGVVHFNSFSTSYAVKKQFLLHCVVVFHFQSHGVNQAPETLRGIFSKHTWAKTKVTSNFPSSFFLINKCPLQKNSITNSQAISYSDFHSLSQKKERSLTDQKLPVGLQSTSTKFINASLSFLLPGLARKFSPKRQVIHVPIRSRRNRIVDLFLAETGWKVDKRMVWRAGKKEQRSFVWPLVESQRDKFSDSELCKYERTG